MRHAVKFVPVLFATVAFIATTPAMAQSAKQPAKVKEEKPGLFKKATVTPEAATATALARVPNGTITAAELEEEKGKLIYSFDIKVAGKSGVEEVAVDAKTGAVIGVEHETPADEKKEAKADKAKSDKAKGVKKP